jgi:transposase
MAQATLKINMAHKSYEEITKTYKGCKNAREKTKWQLIWLMANPEAEIQIREAMLIVGYCENWAREIVHRYNKHGEQGLKDKRHTNKGIAPILTDKQKEKLRYLILNEEPSDGGLWTSVKVANWIKEQTGRRSCKVTGWNYLQILGFRLKQPRTKHIHSATPEEAATFKKT